MKEHFKKEFSHLLESFSFKKRHVLILLYDIIFFCFLFVVLFFAGKTILDLYVSKILSFDFSTVFQGLGVENAYDAIIQFYIYLIVICLSAYLLILLVYSFMRMLIWNHFFESKNSKKLFLKYFVANLFIFPLVVALVIFLVNNFNTSGAIISAILAFLFFHFNTYFVIHYVKHKSIFKALKLSFLEGMKVHNFYLGYFFLFFMIAMCFYLFSFNSLMGLIVLPIILFLVFFWYRNYMHVKHL